MPVCRGAAHVLYRCPSHTLSLVLIASAFAAFAVVAALLQWKGTA